MALLGFPMHKAVVVPRSKLYYNQWQFVIMLHLPEASFLRVLSHDVIDENVTYRNEWIARRGGAKTVDAKQIQILHTACDYLLSRKNQYKKVVYGNGIWLYTNNPEDFQDINCVPSGKVLYVNQVELSITPNAVVLKNPKYDYRTYFKERWLANDELSTLRQYFKTRKNLFRLGPGFTRLIDGSRMWMTSNYFVDHDEPNADFLINLVVPNIVRKTLPIIKRDK